LIDNLDHLAYGARMITIEDHRARERPRVFLRLAAVENRISARLTGWSTRRRWALLVALPALMLCCGGTAVGAPVMWLVSETEEAGKGAPAPEAAADIYLTALGYGNEAGLLPVLDDPRQDALMKQWHEYRAVMDSTTPRPSRLDFGGLSVSGLNASTADVSVAVTAVWWNSNGNGMSYNSTAETWRFRVIEADGWRVSTGEPPQWCGDYVREDAC